MNRAHAQNQQTESLILQNSKFNLIHRHFNLETLQKLALGKQRSTFRINTKIPDHLNFNPPFFHEYWMPHPWIFGVWGSHLGRVYLSDQGTLEKLKDLNTFLKSDQLPPGSIVPAHSEKRYMYSKLPFPRVVYRIISECWYDIKQGWHVHHIDNNSWDCSVENLIPLNSVTHLAIHKPYRYKHKYNSLPVKKPISSGKETYVDPKLAFTGIFHPRWKGFILVYSGTVSQEPQFIFRDLDKFSKWFSETYSPIVTKGLRKGQELSLHEIRMVALSPDSSFFLGFNVRISFWIPPLSQRMKWKSLLPENSEIKADWILLPNFQNLEKMQNS